MNTGQLQSFNVAVAAEYGILEAIFIKQMQTCLKEKKANNEPREWYNKYWMEFSVRMFPVLFPYAKKEEVEEAIANLQKRKVIKGVIESPWAKEWYSFVDEERWLK